MSALIKQIRESYKRRFGYDAAMSAPPPPAPPPKSLAQILKEHPLMTIDPGWWDVQRKPEDDAH